ncbi:MAG: NADP(H)-dependent aldo-keto reductase [Candidatus Thiodiazotropha sp.]|jgi:aryl-alcohol dehydrogenase-like predicted oxidoreductase
MEYRPLGRSGLRVSALCLGTMTFGEQNSEAEAHAQLDRAVAAGINFIDTAEMYPVPPRAETQGLTERYIGSWLAKRGRREDLLIATKVAGPADWLDYLRDGHPRLDRSNIEAALESSLRRLGTDYIDIYQLHWPDRDTNYFGQLGYVHNSREQSTPIQETLEVLADLVAKGKIRHIGLSNETPWGLMQYLQCSQTLDLPRAVSIQNPYNLLNRSFEIGLAEIAHREACGLLAYSPMAFGVLSAKYLNKQRPANARVTLFSRFSRYSNPESERATQAYAELAREHAISPAQMALAWVTSRPFVTSNIIGATTLDQLEENLGSLDLRLSPELLEGIEAIHRQQPNPAP